MFACYYSTGKCSVGLSQNISLQLNRLGGLQVPAQLNAFQTYGIGVIIP
jgi:hypothetical protein